MKQKLLLTRTIPVTGAVILGAFGFASEASATVILQDNFDGYVDNAAFLAAWPATVGTGHTLTNLTSLTPPNSVSLLTTAQRNDRIFAETGNPSALNVIRFSIDFFDGNAAAAPYRHSFSLVDATGGSAGQVVSLGMNNSQGLADSGGNYYMARILGYAHPAADAQGGPNEAATGTAVSTYFKLNDYGVGLRTTGWHNLAVEITDTEFRFYIDGALAETEPNTVTLRSYDSVRIGSGFTSTVAANADNVSVETNPVPEPGASALALLGGLMLLRRRR